MKDDVCDVLRYVKIKPRVVSYRMEEIVDYKGFTLTRKMFWDSKSGSFRPLNELNHE